MAVITLNKNLHDFKNIVLYDFDKELKVTKVIYNNPATIVYFSDGSKSVVKLHPEDTFNETTGLLMAISKRLLGSKNLNRTLKDFTKNYD